MPTTVQEIPPLPPTADATLELGLQRLGLTIPLAAKEQLLLYFSELKKWSQRINLIAKASDAEIMENHFLDSLTLLPLVASPPASPLPYNLMDVGSGAGFPGLVLKIACPALPVTLVEPREKRVSFLKQIIRTLRLQEIKVVTAHLRPADQEQVAQLGQFSIITCRALTETSEFLALCQAFSLPGGKVLCMKGPKAEAEIINWRASSPLSPYQLNEIRETQLPFSKALRSLVVFAMR